MKKRGFTLIELLAVIVVLAIILFISTPIILGVVNSAQKGVAENSTYGYIDAIEKTDLKNMIDQGTPTIRTDGIYNLSNIGPVEYKGTAPTEICVVIKDGSVESGTFQFGKYVVDYADTKAKVNTEKQNAGCDGDSSSEEGPKDVEDIKDDTKIKNGDSYYEGSNPNNWVLFGRADETDNNSLLLWRIVKIDKTGIKIVYEGTKNGENTPLEDGRALLNGTMGVPWNSSGENKWNESDLVEKLTQWLTRIAAVDIDKYITSTTWNVGAVPDLNPSTLRTFLEYGTIDSIGEGGEYKGVSTYKSPIGMINAWDFMYASNNEKCSNNSLETGSSNECVYDSGTNNLNNFLYKNKYSYWTMNAVNNVRNLAWNIANSGILAGRQVNYSIYSVRPVVNLKLGTKFVTGDGTIENPYIVEDYLTNLFVKPSIQLNGENSVTIYQGDSYVDQGVIVTDEQDGDITDKVTVTSNLNINKVGTYTITYNVTDSDGNKAIPVKRSIEVIDKDTPKITLKGSNPTYVTIGDGYSEEGAIASDPNYGDLSNSIIISGTVDTNTLGTYYLTYNVMNVDGLNAPQVERKVIVKASVPKITLNGSNLVLVDIGTSYTDEGATASDAVFGDLTNSLQVAIKKYNISSKTWDNVSNINTNETGSYQIHYSVTNDYGSNTYINRNVNVVSVAGPSITYNPNENRASKNEQSTTIAVTRKQYDINLGSQKYFTVNSLYGYSSSTQDFEKLFKTNYKDGDKLKIGNTTGRFYFYAMVKDIYNDTTYKKSGLFQVDNSKPIIYLNSGPSSVLLNRNYTDPGATAYDEYFDGSLTNKIVVENNVNTSRIGTYQVIYKVKDSAENETRKVRNIVVYHSKPTISLVGGSNVKVRYGSPYTELGYQATDEVDGNLTSNVSVTGTVDTHREGVYSITYQVTNSSGYTTTNVRTVEVYIPSPEITILGNNPTNVMITNSYVDLGATAVDALDGNLTNRLTVTSNVNTSVEGTYQVVYRVTNNLGKTSTATRTVKVYVNAPKITLKGVNPVTLYKGQSYTDAGAVVMDDLDGDLTSNLAVTSTVNTNIAGTYKVTYEVSNRYNKKSTLIRTVIVRNPNVEIKLNGASTIEVPIGYSYVDLGATASDELLGDITENITVMHNVNTNVLGTYRVVYTVVSNGVTATAIRTIKVTSLTGPLVTFGTNGNSNYLKENRLVVTVNKNNYDVLSDSLYYQWTTSLSKPTESSFVNHFTSGNTIETPVNATGKYYLWILAKDIYGNTSIVPSNVFRLDNTAPVLILQGKRLIEIPVNSNYKDAGVSVIENDSGLNSDGVVTTSNVLTDVIGTYQVTYKATDKAGNVSTVVKRTVSVIEQDLRNSPGEGYEKKYDASYFVGSNPNNYIIFGNASDNDYDYIPILWRIIKADDNGIKIIYEGVANGTGTNENGTIGSYPFDSLNNNYNRPADIISILNNFYKNLKDENKDTLTKAINWCVGATNTPYSIDTFRSDECKMLSTNKSVIGLASGLDYLLTTEAACDAYNQASCGERNFLKKDYSYFTFSSDVTSGVAQFIVNSNGALTRVEVSSSQQIRPVINLRSDVLIKGGEGTYQKPYQLNTRVPVQDTKAPTVSFTPNDSAKNIEGVEVLVSDDITGVDNNSLKYFWSTSATAPSVDKFVNSFSNGDQIEIPKDVSAIYYLWILAKDKKGNQSITKSGTYRVDNDPPIITMKGNNPCYIPLNGDYRDEGATAIDNYDGDVSSNIIVTSDINPSVLGEYTVQYTVSDSSGNKASVSRTVIVSNQTADGILSIAGDREDGDYTIIVNNVHYNIEYLNVYGDTTYTANVNLGNNIADQRMLIVRYHGNLTINSGVTVTATTRKKGMLLSVAGTLINNGTITMTARGANALGENVYLYRGLDGKYEFVPANGAAGGAGFVSTIAIESSSQTQGKPGSAGSSRQTGGGGTGGAVGKATAGAGTAGTSYSGGTGGGGGYNSAVAGSGVINGGAGGSGKGNAVYTWSCGGGAGNPGGSGINGGASGATGTGGLLIIDATNIVNNGVISSNGSAGGSAYRSGGGGSGGGSVNIFYRDSIVNGTITATGGASGKGTRSGENSNGGAGGAGTVTITKK